MMLSRRPITVSLALITTAAAAAVLVPATAASAQQQQQSALATATPAAPVAAAGQPIAMDFPPDGVELKTLVDIVTKQLHIPILYDESINNKKVIIRVPVEVPESALLGVLQSALRMKQLALIDADQPGWKQIVPASSLAALARAPQAGVAPDAGTALVQVFALKQADPSRIIESIRPFLTSPGGSAVPLAGGQKAILVSDYASVVQRVGDILSLLDSEATPVESRFVAVKQGEAAQLASTVTQLLASKETAAGGNAATSGVFLAPDERTNQIVVVAPASRMKEVVALIDGLDKPVELQTRVYRLTTLQPDRVDKLMKNLLGGSAKRSYQATVDADSQSLIVSATPDVHEKLESMVKDLDTPISEKQSPMRFYKLKNTKAADVLATIQSLYADNGNGPSNQQPPTGADTDIQRFRSGRGDAALSSASMTGASGNRLAGAVPPPIPAADSAGAVPPPGSNTTGSAGRPGTSDNGDLLSGRAARSGNGNDAGNGMAGGAFRAPNATVTADVNTNSIIVIAPPAVQQLYEQLIKRLDERRPQVQIECTIVTLDTTDGLTFGVDVGNAGGYGKASILSFGSFGVSKLDPTKAALAPIAATGGTFALLDPRVADVVLRALASNAKARLMSAPQLLVNDNGKGSLTSVAQEPFAEILDTSTNQSRTGLGGEAQAGTKITVEPHISQDDYLQLAYNVELSSFTGSASNGLPPPSQKNTIDSTVTIPDGYTIVVGGLTVKNLRSTTDSLPGIRNIPVLRWLIGSRSKTEQDTTIFVFIRPVILRDDKFEDLKYLSGRRAKENALAPDLPHANPIPIRSSAAGLQ